MGFSQTETAIVCLLVVVVLLVLTNLMMRHWKISNIAARREKLPPGPKQLPIVGNLHQVGELPHIYFHKLSLRYGPLLFLRFGSTPVLVVSSSSMARKFFIDNDLLFLDRNVSYAQNKLSYGSLDIAFSPYGEYWKQLRRVCSMELLSPKRVESLRAIREEEVEWLVTSIIRESSSSPFSPVNLSSMLLSLVNNMVCGSAFGDKYRERDNHEKYSMGRLQQLLTQSQALLRGMTLADYFPWLHWANRFSSFHSKLESNFSKLDDIFSQVIEKHQDPDRTKGNFEDLIDVLLKVQINDPSLGNIPLTPNHIKAILMVHIYIEHDIPNS